METIFLTAGIVCVVGAIIGGGLKAFGIDLPFFTSNKRQAVLAIFGVILIFGSIYINPKRGTGPGPSDGHNQDDSIKDIKISGTISTTRTDSRKEETQCISAPSGWSIDASSIQITTLPENPRPWGYSPQNISESQACFNIWLSRYDNDPVSVTWFITAKAYKN